MIDQTAQFAGFRRCIDAAEIKGIFFFFNFSTVKKSSIISSYRILTTTVALCA